MTVYAHSTPDPDRSGWEPLTDHLAAVGERASRFASVFGWGAMAGLSGRLHDIGKCSAAFQAYIRKERSSGGDHSGAGARETLAAVPAPLGQALAAVVAGHHAGLADGLDLDERLRGPLPSYPDWQAHSGPLPAPAALVPTRPFTPSPDPGFSGAFLTRMLFSCVKSLGTVTPVSRRIPTPWKTGPSLSTWGHRRDPRPERSAFALREAEGVGGACAPTWVSSEADLSFVF